MEKNTLHYSLDVIKAEVTRLGAKAFTNSALQSGREMGLVYQSMQKVVYSLERRMLYKSMTSYADHRAWQDVYHATFNHLENYIKVTYCPGGGAPVISFKEKNL